MEGRLPAGASRDEGGNSSAKAKPYEGLTLEERWDELLCHAFEVGLSEDEFWLSTPRELELRARAYRRKFSREALYIAWHVAALSRVEKMPSLEDLLADPKTPAEIEAERLEAERAFKSMLAVRNAAKAKQPKLKGLKRSDG